jgi:hypothetical protein
MVVTIDGRSRPLFRFLYSLITSAVEAARPDVDVAVANVNARQEKYLDGSAKKEG